MKHLPVQMLIISTISLIMSGCMVKQVYTPENIYQGYPCGNACSAFKLGFDKADNENYKLTEQCDSIVTSQKIGCLSYVHEYQTNHEISAVIFDSQGRSQ